MKHRERRLRSPFSFTLYFYVLNSNMDIDIGNDKPFFLIAGPCQIESQEHAYKMASEIKTITEYLGISLIYKSSFDKANRTSLHGKRGPGMTEGLKVFDYLKSKMDINIITDVHTAEQCSIVAPHVDAIQIPAFLCRQTDLLIAAGKTGLGVNIKKGQFMSPNSMKFALEKVRSTGNNNIWLCERGSSFGYNDLIVDATSIYQMKKHGAPVIMDCTHSVQKPNQTSGVTGGDPSLIDRKSTR